MRNPPELARIPEKSCHSASVLVRHTPVHPVESYLSDLHASLGAGTPETSGYPALSNLLNAIGETLKPKITAVIHPANNGAGIPDGRLFFS